MQVPIISFTKSNADEYYGITFLARARHKTFWEKWARQWNQTATAFLIVTSWTCNTLSAQQTSCEWRLPFEDTSQSFKENLLRQCDSRNLNLNPLCMLKPGSLPALWTERVPATHSKDHFWYSHFFYSHLQAKKTYKTYDSSIPSYISALANPMRKRHKDNLLVTESTVNPCEVQMCLNLFFKDDFYNAWEEDIAVVSIFFGKGTVMGEMNLVICNLPRAWEKHQNGSGRLRCLSRRTLWPLSWIQHHLIPRDCLLASCWLLQDHVQQDVNEVLKGRCKIKKWNMFQFDQTPHPFEMKLLGFWQVLANVVGEGYPPKKSRRFWSFAKWMDMICELWHYLNGQVLPFIEPKP